MRQCGKKAAPTKISAVDTANFMSFFWGKDCSSLKLKAHQIVNPTISIKQYSGKMYV